MSEDDSTPTDEHPDDEHASQVEEVPPPYPKDTPVSVVHAPSDISDTLKPPILPNVNPDAITQEQAFAGISIHIPGSVKLCEEDVIFFYWGRNVSVTTIYHRVGANSIVRVMCLSYNFLTYLHYGLVDLYYEIYRDKKLIGTSPALKVTVNHAVPVTLKQRQRKRWISRRYPDN
ncbi:hypothetical protein BZK31_05860 [Pseudomonas floridensis]|uniref:Uncharacterized protein n=1 Tax=Pseudomonas floridensis TaxID=1958950 RepID=A0A1X0NA69_9PSED|nr:hypothetical protein [Pseudomonas floridensis]ORC60660.1 hypothetical protein BZK31_05860 [Pseudomonas floridensis]